MKILLAKLLRLFQKNQNFELILKELDSSEIIPSERFRGVSTNKIDVRYDYRATRVDIYLKDENGAIKNSLDSELPWCYHILIANKAKKCFINKSIEILK